MLEFLLEVSESAGLLSVAELLKWDTDKESVLDYLAEKAPTITTAGLKSFFSQRKKAEKEGSTNIKKDGVAVPSEVNPRQKRKRAKKEAELAESKEGDSPILPIVEAAYESQKRLHAYREDDNMRLLWSRFFPFATLTDELCRFPEDSKMINEVGRAGISRFLQVVGARIVAVGRAQELAIETEEKESLNIAELSASLQEKEKTIVELSSSLKQKGIELDEEKKTSLVGFGRGWYFEV